MIKILYESLLVGIISTLLGSIIFKILMTVNSIDKNDNINSFLNKYKKTCIIEITFFFTGIIIHLLLEYIGLNKWYCEKKCAGEGINRECKYVCKRLPTL